MISANSRYANSQLATVKFHGKDTVFIVPSTPTSFTFIYTFYTITPVDVNRVDRIAFAFYGDPTKWWKIADANPEIMDWSALVVGTVIRIPNA
jgi:hypothetical protein